MLHKMTRTRIVFLLFILSVLVSVAILLPGCFKDPRKLAIGEWQEFNKLGYVDVSETTARWSGSSYKGTFTYTWIQTDSEPYSVEVSRNGESWLAGVTFESDDFAVVDLYIMDKLPAEARKFIQQKNRAKNRPEDEFKLRFRRVKVEK